jgi:hypothetical protein
VASWSAPLPKPKQPGRQQTAPLRRDRSLTNRIRRLYHRAKNWIGSARRSLRHARATKLSARPKPRARVSVLKKVKSPPRPIFQNPPVSGRPHISERGAHKDPARRQLMSERCHSPSHTALSKLLCLPLKGLHTYRELLFDHRFAASGLSDYLIEV